MGQDQYQENEKELVSRVDIGMGERLQAEGASQTKVWSCASTRNGHGWGFQEARSREVRKRQG